MTAAPPMAPDERALREHVASARFMDGVGRKRWRLAGEIEWPHALIAVSAAPRPNAPAEFFLRFDLAGYPVAAPTAAPWDPERGGVLAADFRPKGVRAGMMFRCDWENGRALYAPFDRVALAGHPAWPKQHPRNAWTAKRNLAWVLEYLHELLNDADYAGV